MKKILLTIAMILVASQAFAQLPAGTVIAPTVVEFDPSPDHSATHPTTGAPVVESYEVRYHLNGATSTTTPVITVTLGKPTPQADGKIRALNIFGGLISDTVYQGVVAAVGSGGAGVSAPSNPFVLPSPARRPAAPTNVRIIRGS